MNQKKDQTAVLAQVLEDAVGCRTVVASRLLLELPQEITDELVTCDEHLTRLIVAACRLLGLEANLN